MVSGALVMNPAINNPQGGGGAGGAGDQRSSRSGAEEYNDALVSTSAATTAHEAAAALSPPEGSYGLSPMGHTREADSDDDDDDDDQGYDRDHSYSSSMDHQQLYQRQEQLQPQSPMVTPPTRSYQRTAALDTTVSIGVANSSSSSSPQKSERRSSAGSAAAGAAAAATAGLTYTAVSVGVPHVYRDHSQLPDDDSFIRKKTGGVTQPFPEKLQEMLRAVEGTENVEIVSWLPHGRAFLVRKPKEFTEVIMPK
jgi:hypothetical protein